jgi:hypothetical protein
MQGGTVVNDDRQFKADVLVEGDKITAVGQSLKVRNVILCIGTFASWHLYSACHISNLPVVSSLLTVSAVSTEISALPHYSESGSHGRFLRYI